MALTNVVDFYSTPASAKTGMRSRYVTQSNGVVVRKSSIRKLNNDDDDYENDDDNDEFYHLEEKPLFQCLFTLFTKI